MPSATGHQPAPGSARSPPRRAATTPSASPARTESVNGTKLRSRPSSPRERTASAISNAVQAPAQTQNSVVTAGSCTASGFTPARRALLLLVPRGEDARPVLRDRDRELEMGGQRAVRRVHRPVV